VLASGKWNATSGGRAALLMTMVIGAYAQGAAAGSAVPQAQIDPKVVQAASGRMARTSGFTRLSPCKRNLADAGRSDRAGRARVHVVRHPIWCKSLWTATKFPAVSSHRGRCAQSVWRYIRTLFKDREGRLWIGCEAAARSVRTCNGDIHPLSVRITRAIRARCFPRHISEGGDGMLWVATGPRPLPARSQIGHSVGFHP